MPKGGVHVETFNFGTAIEKLKAGAKVTRTGWNGKDMFIYYVPAASYPAVTEVAKANFGETVPYRAYFAIKPVDGQVGPWTITNTDALAEDWVVVA